MFMLVKDVERYPEFLPWCDEAIVHVNKADLIEATLEIHKRGVRKRFRTRNAMRDGEWLGIELMNGPFKSMSGGWTFFQLGDAGCKVTLRLSFEFESRATDIIFGRFFENTCNALVDLFTQRANETYGRR